MVVSLAMLKVHDVDQEGGSQQQQSLVDIRLRGEGDREGVRVGELRMDRLPHAYQLTRPAVPLALDAADGVGAVVDDVVDDLAAGAEGEEAPLSWLAAGGLDGHALRARIIHDREVVVEAVEDVLHVAAALAVGVQDVHLGSVQTED